MAVEPLLCMAKKNKCIKKQIKGLKAFWLPKRQKGKMREVAMKENELFIGGWLCLKVLSKSTEGEFIWKS